MTTDDLKALGNKAFTSGNYTEAIDLFTKAIKIDPSNHILYSNRSGSYASLKDYNKALEDSDKCIELDSKWTKATALFGLNQFEEAKTIAEEGLKLEPENKQLQGLIQQINHKLTPPGDVLTKIRSKPKLAPYLSDLEYLRIVGEINKDPTKIQKIMTTIIHLMGMDMGQDDLTTSNDPTHSNVPPSQPETKKARTPSPEPVKELSKEDIDRENSNKEKDIGNQFYKKRDFEEALSHYAKAIEIDPTNVAALTNKAAVLFEMNKYQECIKECENAIDIGREHRIDYKFIANRIGNSYYKLADFDNAIKYYNKSLTEHRSADVEKEKIQKEKNDYYNPELSDKAREEGNQLFKENKYALAVTEYTEAIKRNEKDVRNYSNRAACYTKLMAISEALKDSQTCIALDPTFIKGYIRKAAIEFLKKEYTTCIETCQLAKTHDVDKKHASEIDQQIYKCYAEINKSNSTSDDSEEAKKNVANKVQNDPELQSILSDPVMRQILEQMQTDPNAMREHMKNPVVMAKIQKLISAGVIKVG